MPHSPHPTAPPPPLPVFPLKVLEKYGDIYGRERIAELLGMELSSLEIGARGERKPPPDNSVLTWWVCVAMGCGPIAAGGPHSSPCAPRRITSIDIRYQIWKFGVIFTDNVSGGGCGVGRDPKSLLTPYPPCPHWSL